MTIITYGDVTRKMAEEGRNNREIADALGVNRTTIARLRKHLKIASCSRGGHNRKKDPRQDRKCLSCGNNFPSTHNGNRICPTCRGREAWATQQDCMVMI
ncbi:MAG: helix-turn-helix domain-containing protein [Alphaproteobacteria bacterium]|nr:helix-turn-helix domain-containing protein [Alphaproteobacteria bacterium]